MLPPGIPAIIRVRRHCHEKGFDHLGDLCMVVAEVVSAQMMGGGPGGYGGMMGGWWDSPPPQGAKALTIDQAADVVQNYIKGF